MRRLKLAVIALLVLLGAACAPASPGVREVAVDKPSEAVNAAPEPAAEEPVLAEPAKPVEVAPQPTVEQEPEAAPEPAAVVHNITVLPVPFMVQAPHALWDEVHKEACEEASILMVADYVGKREDLRIPSDEAETRLQQLIAWEGEHGYAIDLTAEETARVLGEKFGISARAVPYDADVLRQEVSAKRPVIIPAAGRLLGNPYFTQPGPLYHMLVIKGFAGDEFITNDPGTKRGENFRYHESVFETAVHDWNGGDVGSGAQLMVILLPPV